MTKVKARAFLVHDPEKLVLDVIGDGDHAYDHAGAHLMIEVVIGPYPLGGDTSPLGLADKLICLKNLHAQFE